MWSVSQFRLFCRPSSSVSQILRHVENDSRNGRRLRSYRPKPKNRPGAGSQSVEGIQATEAAEMHVPQVQRTAKDLWKPFLFTVGFGGGCYVGAAIWEYERVRRQTNLLNPKNWSFEDPRQKFGTWRRQMHEWWASQSRGQKVFWSIAAVNGLVFVAWQLPFLRRPMIRYFTSSFYGEKLYLPMILSAFSHYSSLHLILNMYVLWSFSGQVVDYLMGPEQFVGFYLAAGVVASLFGFTHRAALRLPTYALGASGAILAVLMYTCSKMPDAKLSIVLLPWITFSGYHAILGIVAFDCIGILLRFRLFDHAAHLGGSFFGLWYSYYGERLTWQKRHEIVKKWRELTGR